MEKTWEGDVPGVGKSKVVVREDGRIDVYDTFDGALEHAGLCDRELILEAAFRELLQGPLSSASEHSKDLQEVLASVGIMNTNVQSDLGRATLMLRARWFPPIDGD